MPVVTSQEATAPERCKAAEHSRSGWDLRALGLILVVALALRLYKISSVPGNLTADELDNLQTVYHILSGTGPGLFGLDWKPAPALSTHILAWSLRAFGDTIFALRLPSAALSTAALVPFYLLARSAVPKPAALAGAALLATNLWYLHFSRSGWENVHAAFYGGMAALCLARALEPVRRRYLWYAGCGVFCALGLLGYMAGTFIIVGVLAFLPFALFLQSNRRRTIVLGYGVVLAVTAVLYAPQLKTVLDAWEFATRRHEVVSIFSIKGDYLGDTGLPAILWSQTARTFQGFFLFDSGVMRYGQWPRYVPPQALFLDSWTIVLYWTGLVGSLFILRKTLLWWTMLLAMLVPQVLSVGTPDGARGVLAAPFMYLFVALGVFLAWRGLVRGLHWLRTPSHETLASVALAVLVLLLARSNVVDYYAWQRSPGALQARYPAVEPALLPAWKAMAWEAARQNRLVGEEWPAWLATHGNR